MRINDPPAKLWLSLFVDSDFGLSPDMKSTSGFISSLLKVQVRFLLFFGIQKPIKTQRAVFRSTTEAAFVALGILDLLCIKPITAT